MSRPFCLHVAMLQDGASSDACFVNKLTLLLVDFKMNVIKWKLHFVSCNFGLKFCNHAFDFRPNCTPLSGIPLNSYCVYPLLVYISR